MPRTSDLPTDSVDAQVTIVGATMPKELVDSLQDMLLVRTDISLFLNRSATNTHDAPTRNILPGAFFYGAFV